MSVVVAPEVRDALATAQPVVALESTIFSPFGLPAPANVEALDRCLAAVRTGGAVPALTAVLDGRPRVGLDPAEHERILTGGAKVAARDLAVAMARSSAVGVTTVSAALALAAAAGISVFATGGIGGVHREVGHTGDVSADLGALAAHSLVTVSAGAKAFLDLPRTLEHLEMLGVPVLGWRTDEFPMFWCVSSGLPVPYRVDEEAQVAAVLRAQRALGLTGGVLLAVPIPAEDGHRSCGNRSGHRVGAGDAEHDGCGGHSARARRHRARDRGPDRAGQSRARRAQRGGRRGRGRRGRPKRNNAVTRPAAPFRATRR